MSRAKRCVKWLHWHVGQCNVQGYKNGRADTLEQIEAAVAEHAFEFHGDPDYLVIDVDRIREALNG